MPTTSKGFPYPQSLDDDKPRLDIEELAQFLDAQPGIRSVTTTQRNALTTLWEGMLIYNRTTQRVELNRSGTAGDWVGLFSSVAPLPIANGGTGLAEAPQLLVNLGSLSAASPLSAEPRPGVTGVLPITSGGTGRQAAPQLLVNLESPEAVSPLIATPRPGVTGVLPRTNGGTGTAGVVGIPGATIFSNMGDLTVSGFNIRRFGAVVVFNCLININSAGPWSKGVLMGLVQLSGTSPLPAILSPVVVRASGGVFEGASISTDGAVEARVGTAFSSTAAFVTGVYLTNT